MIEFKNVNFSYGELNVLKDFDLSIKKGERICLYGKSGLGKTTVLRLISGLEKAENIAPQIRSFSDNLWTSILNNS